MSKPGNLMVALNDVTRDAVLAAIAEHDQLGQEAFLDLSVVVNYTTQDPARAVAAAELIDDRVIGDLLSHASGSRPVQVPRAYA